MARTFDDVDDKIRWSIGGLTATTAFGTFAAILRRGTNTTFDSIIGLHTSGDVVRQWLQIESGDNLQLGNSTGGALSAFTVTSSDGWVLVAVGKASGTVAPRYHKYVFSTDTWTHSASGDTLGNGTAAGAGGYAENTWQGSDFFSGDLAAMAVFPGISLADPQVESLAYSLAFWHALTPAAMWVLDQSATGQAVPDVTGGGANQSSLTGTTVATSSVPVLGYGASAGLWSAEPAAAPPVSAPPPNPYRRRLPLLVR